MLFRSNVVCCGYTDPEITAQAFTEDGFLRTGDVGYRRPDGRLVLTGRKKELIIRKGENISPSEVEQVLIQADLTIVAPGLPTADLQREAEDAIEEVLRRTVDPDVRVEFVRKTWHRPMEKKEGVARLADLAHDVARDLGFEHRDASTGGGSDACTTAALGVPTLDGLGPVGGDAKDAARWDWQRSP